MAMAICALDGTLLETLGEDGEECIPPDMLESEDGDDHGMSHHPEDLAVVEVHQLVDVDVVALEDMLWTLLDHTMS